MESPRCFEMFEMACSSKRTRETYTQLLNSFLKWASKDYESLLVLTDSELQILLENYMMYCKKRFARAGIEGGLMIYHPFAFDEKSGQWVKRPHFHVVGFGWVVNTKKISDSDGWVIKNKGLRNSLHSTIYYQLSHAGVSDGVCSITWFGSLGYRAKYADKFKVDEEDESDFCDYCGIMLVEFGYFGEDKPPDYEFVGLVDSKIWKPLETLEEAVERKEKLKNRYKNPRTGSVDDGQGIATYYSSWLEHKETNTSQHGHTASIC